MWDGARLLGEFNASGTRTQRYAYLGSDFTPSQVQDANGTFYLHTDQLDAPRLATSGTGVIVWKAYYEAFGKTVIDADPDGNGTAISVNLRFPGQYFDSESGLYQNYFRDYDSAIGRYIQGDPIGQFGGTNLYQYVYAAPTMGVDPYGLWEWGDPLPQDLVDGAAGFGDGISMGLTDWLRDRLDIDGGVDPCSSAYEGGEMAGTVAAALGGAGAAAKGLARLSRLPRFRWLNGNPYLRFGRGKMDGPGMPKVDRMSIGPNPQNIATPARAWWSHWRV